MKNNPDIFSQLVKRQKPAVPASYFSDFPEELTRSLSETAEVAESSFGKLAKPKVPDGFFTHFHAQLTAAIEASETEPFQGLTKRATPTVPESFHEDFRKDLMKGLKPTNVNRGRVLKITFWSAAAAIAAGLTLLLTLNTDEPTSETVTTAAVETNLTEEETLDAYVAYLDEESLVDYILENDINVGESETEEAVYDYVDSEIEEAYLDL